jgi:hypothetical protein
MNSDEIMDTETEYECPRCHCGILIQTGIDWHGFVECYSCKLVSEFINSVLVKASYTDYEKYKDRYHYSIIPKIIIFHCNERMLLCLYLL